MVLKPTPAATSTPTPPVFATELVASIREALFGRPDHRKGGNNQRYVIGDATLSAFSVFFMQSPSFLDFQRRMQKERGTNNANTLFGIHQIPSDQQIRNLLDPIAPEQVFVTQASSPFFARKAFWCIGATLAESFDHIMPLKSYVPSFGLWGFHLASHAPLRLDRHPIPAELRFLDSDSAIEAGQFPPDISPVDVEPNRLDNQVLVRYYEAARGTS